MSNILDKAFRYRPSYDTDVGRTIRREQRRLKQLEEERAKKPEPRTVSPIRARRQQCG